MKRKHGDSKVICQCSKLVTSRILQSGLFSKYKFQPACFCAACSWRFSLSNDVFMVYLAHFCFSWICLWAHARASSTVLTSHILKLFQKADLHLVIEGPHTSSEEHCVVIHTLRFHCLLCEQYVFFFTCRNQNKVDALSS